MSRAYRPENAEKRAKEFLDVGKPSRALDVLYEVIRRGKMRNNPCEVLQPIMFMYLRLCVELKKSHLAKEGLYQYRNIFQSIDVSTLETVVRFYLQLAEERTEAARKESHEAVSAVDDLDNLASPEEMLLSAVSGEDAQDRSDRTILTPWVKFLWESYRQCLELLRNNSRVEKLYHEITKKAFNFCERYQRRTEFRKLCDYLLKHLEHLQKPPTSATSVSLSNPETQQMNLETRLVQLSFAIKMELWQEAYRAIEYVSDLMGKSKKSPKPQIMATYYQRLALVFWKAGNQLFHAAALLKLFQLNREQKKNITAEEVSKRASVVLVATMAIPLPSAHPEFDRFIETEKSAMEKIAKLAALLNLPKPPTRISLFRELVRCGVIAAVPVELQNLYRLLEVSFDPLTLCSVMKQQLVWVSQQTELEQYVSAIEEMTVTRLIKELAQIYSTVTFKWLVEVCVFMQPFQLERILVDLVRHNDLQIRIDHRNGCVHFGSAPSECQREDLPEGPTLQPMPSETIRCQLVHMNNALNACLALIVPNARSEEMEGVRSSCIQLYMETKKREHEKILARQNVIEMRKERLENQTLEREESIRKAQELQLQKQKSEEQERLKREATEREKLRQEEQMKQIHTKQIKDKLMQISQTSYGQKMMEKFNEEELLSLDADEILQRQVEELEKERKELQQRLKTQEKKIDYNERAKRLVEIPKFNELYEKQKEQDKEFWKAEEDKRVSKLIEEHRQALEMCKRFNHMKGDLNQFLDGIKSARRSEMEKKLNDFNARLDVERKKRLLERKEQRRREREEAHLRREREEEQRRHDEEMKKMKEMKEKEEMERQRLEEEEYQRKKQELDRQDKMRRDKELEVERQLREKEANQQQAWRASKDTRSDSTPARGSDEGKGEFWRPGAGTWREKEQENLLVWRKKEEADEVAEPPRRDKMQRDIRLDEDFKQEQRRREEERGGGGRDEDRVRAPPRRDDDKYPPARDVPDRRDDDRFPKRDDKFSSSRGGGGFSDRDRNRWNEDDRRGGGGFVDRRGGGGGDFQRGDRDDFRRGGGGGGDRDDFRRRGGDDYRRGGGDDFRRGGGGRDEFRRAPAGGDRDEFRRAPAGGDRDEFRRAPAGGDRDEFRRSDRDGDSEWRRGGGGPPIRAAGRDRDMDRRAPGGGRGDDDGQNWRSKPAESRGAPRRDEDEDGGRGGRGGRDPWRTGGGGRDAPPRREKQAPETDADGWTIVRK
ncbi:Eukaryotic translation initiation factor 3 subunit A [Trinorchestia longiramus]|nr:Eukaryotic translation initiation factor 3 subunit A [Trinorchestia longiramus]